jgi:hypothetical protein
MKESMLSDEFDNGKWEANRIGTRDRVFFNFQPVF